ncbi:trypsin-like serine protease [Amycolatopsis sp. PS_44_ISF1]|uniref:S1 family peptidase n=1 Tax=Amycolatopsis sp. PS_44_ISF1 TaxID=2974917 RepID=UPI0028DDC0FB|nr:trypsin-like serine protease [Amycolatopsis sp. PS_44_ISF1]MDT8913974.1 trypsin-like serine protease [Amycolatopsis sp. PS_44_ISF1]
MSRIRIAGAVTAAAVALTLAGGAVADAQTNIVGGGTAPTVSWGAQVYVNTPGRDFQGFNCSGTVVAPRWVMTAVHCLDEDGRGMFVRVGTNTLYGGTKIAVDQEKQSPNGDIALLHLAQSTNAGPVTLGGADPANGTTNQLYGWGRTTPTGPPASQLKVANVQVTGRSTDAYGGRAIQTVGVNGSAWKGDSGGPEMSNGAQVGVASTVQNQSGTNTRGTNNYASVASSRSWIRSTAGV